MRIQMVPLASRIVTIARSGDNLTDDLKEQIAALKGRFILPQRVHESQSLAITLSPAKVKELRPGVHIMVGGTSSGKSTMAKYIAKHNKETQLLVFEEPEEGDVIVDEVNLGVAIAQAVEAGKRVLVIDSFRTLGYRSSGNTGKGGLDMQLFTWMTHLDIWAKAAGIHIFPILNPINVDEEVVKLLREASSGAVQSAIIVNRPAAEITTRSDDDRAWDSFSFRVSKKELEAQSHIHGAAHVEVALTGVTLDDRLIDLSFPRLS